MTQRTPLAITALLISCSLLTSCLFGGSYTVGGKVVGLQGSGLVLHNTSGKDLDVLASGSFTFPSGLDQGASYSVTVRTQPSNPAQTCSVSNAAGTIAKANVTNVLVSCTQAARFAYVANQTANTISAYAIDANSGTLTPVPGSPFSAYGLTPIALAVEPNGKYLYVAEFASNTISVYAIDTTIGTTRSGALTRTGALIPTGRGPMAIAIDPTNTFLYVANSTDNSVSAYRLSNGAATAIGGAAFTVGRSPSALKTNPTGTTLYVTNFTDGSVSALSIDQNTGALGRVADSPYNAGVGALSVTLDSTGQFAYAANQTAASISAYIVNSTNGQLTATATAQLATGSGPTALVADPSGKYVYAANVPANNSIATYGITPGTGELTLLTSTPTGMFPVSLAVDPSGKFVYAANDQANRVSVYSVDSTSGVLTAVPELLLELELGARSIAVD